MHNYLEKINRFRIENGIEAPDEKIIAVIHLINTYSLDKAQAMAQTSLEGGDHNIDAWHYAEQMHQLIIYRSCIINRASDVAQGLIGLKNSFPLLEDAVLNGQSPATFHHNPCLYNLLKLIVDEKEKIEKIRFEIISPFQKEEISRQEAIFTFEEYLRRSKLNKKQEIQLSWEFAKFNVDAVISKIKEYSLEKSEVARISLDDRTFLELAYVPLHNLVEIYRQRGDLLFDKNVRLSLKNYKKAKDKLVTPMEGR